MSGHLFYILGLLILIFNFYSLFNYSKIFAVNFWAKEFGKVTGKSPITSEFRSKEEYNTYVSFNLISGLDFLWFLMGLVTNSWYIFLGIIVLSFTLRFILNMINLEIITKYVGLAFVSLKFLVILALIINHFHLHINWIDLVK
jgi:hypothetical protein